MHERRRQALREICRNQVAGRLEDDLLGGESIMKEAWEECGSRAEQKVMEDELRAIIRQINNP